MLVRVLVWRVAACHQRHLEGVVADVSAGQVIQELVEDEAGHGSGSGGCASGQADSDGQVCAWWRHCRSARIKAQGQREGLTCHADHGRSEEADADPQISTGDELQVGHLGDQAHAHVMHQGAAARVADGAIDHPWGLAVAPQEAACDVVARGEA